MQKPLPKTIQIFLPDGNARSVRIAEITSRTVQATQVPRSTLKAAQARDEVKGVGVYFLFGDPEDGTKPRVYVGEAEDCYARLTQHHQAKDFWNTAVVVTSKTNAFTKAHAKYLEWYCLQRVKEVGRYRPENTATPSQPYISEPMEADLLDNLETIRVLLSTLGFPLLEAVARRDAQARVYGCAGRGVAAKGEYTEDGFVVLKGSEAALSETPSAADSHVATRREQLREDGVLTPTPDGTRFVFTEDHLFSSPSGAATAVLGRHTNGWTAWKDPQGRTLHELERATDEPTSP